MRRSQRTSMMRFFHGWRMYIAEHPAYLLWRRVLPEDPADLAALGADIKTNGLRIPAVATRIGGQPQLLDGARRLDVIEQYTGQEICRPDGPGGRAPVAVSFRLRGRAGMGHRLLLRSGVVRSGAAATRPRSPPTIVPCRPTARRRAHLFPGAAVADIPPSRTTALPMAQGASRRCPFRPPPQACPQ